MMKNIQEKLLTLAVGAAAVSFVMTLLLVALQAYIRWGVNQNFTFLGAGELETFTVSTFALILGVLYASRTRTNAGAHTEEPGGSVSPEL